MGKSNDLSVIDVNQLPAVSSGSDAMFNELAKSQEYLGRLQLYTKGKAVDKEFIRGGEYGIPESAEDITVLGKEIHVLVLARRPKAIDMSDPEAIFVSHDIDSSDFKRIAAQAGEKESHCMYGPSFLVYEESQGRFLEFFCGSKSSRNSAKQIFPFLALTAEDIKERKLVNEEPHGPLPMTLKSKLVEKGPYTWHVPVVQKRSTPISAPPLERLILEINNFVHPKEDGVERVEEPAQKSGKKARAR